jgi:hypothetical protein
MSSRAAAEQLPQFAERDEGYVRVEQSMIHVRMYAVEFRVGYSCKRVHASVALSNIVQKCMCMAVTSHILGVDQMTSRLLSSPMLDQSALPSARTLLPQPFPSHHPFTNTYTVRCGVK